MWRTMHKLTKTFGDLPGPRRSAESIKKKLDAFKVNLPIIQTICNPGIRDRHWEKVSRKASEVMFACFKFHASSTEVVCTSMYIRTLLCSCLPGCLTVKLFCPLTHCTLYSSLKHDSRSTSRHSSHTKCIRTHPLILLHLISASPSTSLSHPLPSPQPLPHR